jgi:predicted enzyme related to lactoylglutathione lyase
MAGGVAVSTPARDLRSALFDELRAEVPEGSPAVILFAPSSDVDAMISALDGHGGRVVRHRLTADAGRILEEAVAGSPSVAPPPA